MSSLHWCLKRAELLRPNTTSSFRSKNMRVTWKAAKISQRSYVLGTIAFLVYRYAYTVHHSDISIHNSVAVTKIASTTSHEFESTVFITTKQGKM
jgi:hypothetical protein